MIRSISADVTRRHRRLDQCTQRNPTTASNHVVSVFYFQDDVIYVGEGRWESIHV